MGRKGGRARRAVERSEGGVCKCINLSFWNHGVVEGWEGVMRGGGWRGAAGERERSY